MRCIEHQSLLSLIPGENKTNDPWQAAVADKWCRLPAPWRSSILENNVRPLETLSFLLLGWREVNIQHDVAEFLLHILPRVSWLDTRIGWETRTVQDNQVHRQVSNNMPILMLNPAEGLISSNIADAVQTWHLQAGVIVQALVRAPRELIIQLPRFREAEAGIVKHRIPLSLRPSRVTLPVFTGPNDTECSWTTYTIRAALLHLGVTTTSGHYRSVLIEAPSQICWITDDGVSAQPSDLSSPLIEENCYVFFCTCTQEADE